MDAFAGEIAALLAAACFSITSVCYTFAGRKINAITTIALSLPISWLIMMGLHQFTLGAFFPVDAAPERWFFLSLSGILAFIAALYFMLNAYQYIGPRLTMLIASLAPVVGAVLAWIFLGQTLPPRAILGIAVVIFGISAVVGERGSASTTGPERNMQRGLIYAGLGMLAQAASFVFASQGISGGFPPLSATLMRITAGVIALWVLVAFQRKIKATIAIFRNDARLVLQLTGAALSGPVIAGWLLLVSFQLIPVGVSTTLTHTTSIMLIPVGYFVFKERITPRAIVGTIVSIVGIGILFIQG